MNLFHILFAFVYAILASLQSCWAQCYRPDGSNPGTAYQPCHSDQPSMCCALNQLNGYTNKCRPDNLCYEDGTRLIFRESCTDPTWKDPACLQLCTSASGNGTDGDVIITPCGDGSYCCGEDNTYCCDHGAGFWISDNKVYPYPSSPFTSLSVASSTASSNPLTTSLTNSTCDGDSSHAKNIALGVGLGIGIPILILLASILFLMARRSSSAVKYHATDVHQESVDEVSPKTSLAELPHSPPHPSELDAR